MERRTAAAGLANSQLRLQHQSVCEQQQLARERNEALLQDLRQFQRQTVLATPQTDRLKTLKHHYEEHVAAEYPQWAAQVQEHRMQLGPEQQGTPIETSADPSSQSHGLPITAGGSPLRSPVATATASSHHRLLSDSHRSGAFVPTVAPGMEDLSAGTFSVSPLPTPDRPNAIPIGHTPKPTLLSSSASYLGASVAVHLSGINMIATPSTSSQPIMHTRVIPPGAQLRMSIPPLVTTTTARQQPDTLTKPTEHKVFGSMPYRAPVPSPSHRPSRIPVLASRTKAKPLPAKDTPSQYVHVGQPLSRMQVSTAAVREHTGQMRPEKLLALEPEQLDNEPRNLALHDHQTVEGQSGEASEVSPPSVHALGDDEGSQHTMQLECTAVSKVEQVAKEQEPASSKPHATDLTVTAEPNPAQLLTDRPHSTIPAQLLEDFSASLPSLSDSNQEAAPEDATPPATPPTPLSLPLAEIPKSLSTDHTSIPPGESPQPDRLDRQGEGFGHDIKTTDSPLPASTARNARDMVQSSHADTPEGSRNDDLSHHSESNTTQSELPDQEPQLPDQEPQLLDQEAQLPDQEPQLLDQEAQLQDQEPQLPDQEPQLLDQEPQLQDQEAQLPDQEPQLLDQEPQLPDQEPQPVEDAAYSLLVQSMQPLGVSPPSSLLLSEDSEIAEMERQLQASSSRAEGEGQPADESSKQLKSSALLPPEPPKVSAEGSGASQEESESSVSPFSPAYVPTAVEQRSQVSAAAKSKSSALRRKLGFWGDSDSDGSDLELPPVTPLDNEKEDFDFYG